MTVCACFCHPHYQWVSDFAPHEEQVAAHPACDCTCCKNALPLLPELAIREEEVAVSMIVTLIERMEKAHDTLIDMSMVETDPEESKRILAKAGGIVLCLSYAREALRIQT